VQINAISLFSSVGIAELLFDSTCVNVVIANEVQPMRAKCYSHLHPNTKMICGDITTQTIKSEILRHAEKENATMLIATPPCQGISTIKKKQS